MGQVVITHAELSAIRELLALQLSQICKLRIALDRTPSAQPDATAAMATAAEICNHADAIAKSVRG